MVEAPHNVSKDGRLFIDGRAAVDIGKQVFKIPFVVTKQGKHKPYVVFGKAGGVKIQEG